MYRLLQGGEQPVPQPALLPDVPSVGDRIPGTIMLAPKGSSIQDPLWDPAVRLRGMAPFLRSFERRAEEPSAPLARP